ncbi:Uncharacterised protein [Mycobacterium tuberculosis]|uniref:Uncharacterized protein n=1 Tax=Mycobacterium tuberculosis TaxID=1773 RepID=A0A655IWU1_MYCTX|nr:Uncharacterised protein [Mycobacterium tuberculosis]COW24207.1 Uncharacterised protein [Mycobacterium tuberculosis]COW35745.1 Uncharacterised protein [Mycobacterium tuberculosis]COW50941.1 Uncharacterised protein [Mycobacterium tuberculosis]COW96109.1 Uncharacterised protein [Mycobacterium tuberculosis]
MPTIWTTCLPSISPSVSNVGPGPSATNGTVTTASNTPNTTIGTSATIKVNIRLFTPHTLDGPGRAGSAASVTADRTFCSRGEYR